MRRLATLRTLALVSLTAGLMLSACAKVSNNLPTPTAIPTPSHNNREVYTVKRGTINEQVKALGRVVAQQQATLYYRFAGRLFQLHVDTNQKVKKGDLLAEMDVSDLQQKVKVAEVNAQIAQLQVDAAMGKGDSAGPAAAVLTAQGNLAKVEITYAQAQDALDQLLAGSTKADLDAARADVATAQQTLQTDQTALTLMQKPPTANQLTILRASLDKAKAALQQAQSAYDRVKSKPDVAALPESAALQAATFDYQSAQAAFDQATAGPKPADLATAKQQVSSDQKALDASQAKLAALEKGPTPSDIDSARQDVKSAKAAVDDARAKVTAAQGAEAGTSPDVEIAKKQADIAQLNLKALQDQLDEAQLRAPFDGVVTETDVSAGDDLKAYDPVLSISNPAKLEIGVELQPTDLSQVAVGMPASIVLSAYPTAKLQGKIVRMPSIATGNTQNLPANLRTVAVSLPNAPGVVNLGDLANVTIDVQRKNGVLMLPTTAIIKAGSKTYVRVLRQDGTTTEAFIEVGINDDTNTEIVKGLAEGQTVLQPETVPPTPVPAGDNGA